jgi:hypothetical protein
MLARTYSPCCYLKNRELVWAMYNNGKYLGISSAALIAGYFRDKYPFEMEEWRQAHK